MVGRAAGDAAVGAGAAAIRVGFDVPATARVFVLVSDCRDPGKDTAPAPGARGDAGHVYGAAVGSGPHARTAADRADGSAREDLAGGSAAAVRSVDGSLP